MQPLCTQHSVHHRPEVQRAPTMAEHNDELAEEVPLQPLNVNDPADDEAAALPNGTVPAIHLHIPPVIRMWKRYKKRIIWFGLGVLLVVFLLGMSFLIRSFRGQGFHVRGRPSRTPQAPVSVPSSPPQLPWRSRVDPNRVPRILLWNPPKDLVMAAANNSSLTVSVCSKKGSEQYRQCAVTRSRDNATDSDAVVFHSDALKAEDLPFSRSANQVWVFWAPNRLPLGGSSYANKISAAVLLSVEKAFNWSMGHRDDADVHIPYKHWRCSGPANNYRTKKARQNKIEAMSKRKDAAWIVGACEHERIRKEMPKPLPAKVAARIPVSLLMDCGSAFCHSGPQCVQHVAENYHFIFVSTSPDCFESAEELIYDAFQYDVVPVVFVSPNTTLLLPENSFVNAAYFREPGQLASLLRSLLDNRGAYESYFAWKRNCSVTSLDSDLCALCSALYEEPVRKGARLDILEWLQGRTLCARHHFALDSFFVAESEMPL